MQGRNRSRAIWTTAWLLLVGTTGCDPVLPADLAGLALSALLLTVPTGLEVGIAEKGQSAAAAPFRSSPSRDLDRFVGNRS